MSRPASSQVPRAFRVFVSSSFADMHAERDALQRRAFPRLQRYCKAREARFQAIDLRWGVARSLVEQNATMTTCLREVDRCKRLSPRPMLVVLLGNRYGWIPAPHSIDATTFERVLSSVTPWEQQLLCSYYRRDATALPPKFVLVRRPNGGDPDWQQVEGRLCELLRPHLELLSATETEIRRALAGELLPRSAFAYFRDLHAETNAAIPSEFLQSEFAGRVTGLRAFLEQQLGRENCRTLDARWSANGVSPEYLSRLCDDVFEQLKRSIDEQLAASSDTSTSGQSLPPSPPEQAVAPKQLFTRLAEAHGSELVARLLGFLLLSRTGLAEDELLELASGDARILAEMRSRYPDSPQFERLPVVLWSRLHDDLERHISEQVVHGLPFLRASPTIEATFWRELGADLPVRQLRFYMAHYFSTQGQAVRHLDELAWLAFTNENWPELEKAMNDQSLVAHLAREQPSLLDHYRGALLSWRGGR